MLSQLSDPVPMLVHNSAAGARSIPTRYCDYETFSARCDSTNEVVHVRSAVYGRRSTGRCLEPSKVIDALRQDDRYYGCHADVLSIADRKCSGRHDCTIGLPDPDFEQVTPCYEELRKYLEIGYTCEKGQTVKGLRCSPITDHSVLRGLAKVSRDQLYLREK